MIPIRDNLQSRDKPIVTWTLIGLNVIIYLWDRMYFSGGSWHWGSESMVFADLAMRPSALRKETGAWAVSSNDRQRGVDWKFTIEDARHKLKSLYPNIQG